MALTPQGFSAARSLTGFCTTGAKTGRPSFSFLAMAKMQQSAAIATTAAAMRPPTSPASSLLDFFFFLEPPPPPPPPPVELSGQLRNSAFSRS